MKRVLVAGVAAAAAALGAGRLEAQSAMVRGTVVDTQGQPIPGAKVEIECTQDNRPKKFNLTTDKKGGYVRVGLPGGPCKISFSKEGYVAGGVDVTITLGGLSEIPAVVLKARPAGAVAAPSGGSAIPDAGANAPSAGGQASAPPDATEKLKEAFGKAVEAGKAGRLDEAEALYKEILVAAPNTPEVHFNLGVISRRKKDWPAAEAEFKKVVELQPDRSDGYLALAAMYEASGQMDKALEVLTEAAPKFEQDPRFQFQLAIAYTNAGRAEDALVTFKKTAALDPANPEVYFYLGTSAVGRNQVPEAVQSLEKYVSLSGQNPQNLATAQALLKELKKK